MSTQAAVLSEQAIYEMGNLRSKLLTSIENESAISEFLAEVQKKLDLKGLILYFVNPAYQTLEAGARFGISRKVEYFPRKLDFAHSVPGKSANTGKTVFERNTAPSIGTAEMATPIKIGSQVIAVLDSFFAYPVESADSHQYFLDQAAADLAIALMNLQTVRMLKDSIGRDELTGAYKKSHFLEVLEIEIKRARRTDSLLAVLFFEPDDLNEVIVKWGDKGLEQLILTMGRVLKKNCRATDLLGRYQDTSLILSLAGADIEKSLLVAEKLRNCMVEALAQDLGSISISAGIAVFPTHAMEGEDLIFMAQQAFRLAKHGGGNQVYTIGNDRMKREALKAFAKFLSSRHFHTGPEVADEVANYLGEVSANPVFSLLVREIVESLASAIDAKDQYTGNHSEEAAVYAEALGKACGLPEKQLELVRAAAKLHDLGKIGIPEQILMKPGPLDDREMAVMKEHPNIGARIMQPIHSLAELVPIVKFHHERWNGSGYPMGLKEAQIPLEARIIGVIDSFHAMVSKRPYKDAMPFSDALDRLRQLAGTDFDPVLVEKFLELFDQGILSTPHKVLALSPHNREIYTVD